MLVDEEMKEEKEEALEGQLLAKRIGGSSSASLGGRTRSESQT